MKTIKRIWEWCKDHSDDIRDCAFFALLFASAYWLVSSFHLNIISKYLIINILIALFFSLIVSFVCFLLVFKEGISKVWKQIKSDPQSVGNYFLSFIRDNGIIFSLVLLYVLFYHFWESWIENHIIDSFLRHFEPNPLTDNIFVIATITCLVLICLKTVCFINTLIDDKKYRQKKVKQQTLILSIIAIVFWAYYRFYGICGLNDSQYYMYLKPLTILKPIKYFDFVFVFAFYKCISYFYWKAQNYDISIPEFNETNGLIRNLPIKDKEHDLLERDEFANSIVKELWNTNTSDSSFTFGIDAPWGSGKTSFINLMKSHIDSYDKSMIIIIFNPWLYAAEKDLISAFFDELSKTLKQYDTSLAKNLIDYSKLLSAFDTTETKLISSLLELTRNDDSSLQVIKQQISEAIKRIKRRIMVFIDDLDRLEANEIMEMMKLIRNVSDFPYMYIIAAYDKSYVVKCLSTKMKSGATNFIEKIFEHEHILPPCNNDSLRRALVDQLSSRKSYYYRISSSLENYIMDHNNKALDALSNLRDIYRLSNIFASTLELSKRERIHKKDLLLFCLFKTKYPVAFSLFEHRWHEVLVKDDSQEYYELFHGNHYYSEFFHAKSYESHFDFIQYLDGHQEEMSLNEFDIKTIKVILSELFTHHDNERENERRINNVKWFDLYLNFTELKTDIPEKEFKEVMGKEIDEIKKHFNEWLVNKSVSLKYRLLSYDNNEKLNRKQLEKNIQGLFYATVKMNWEIYDELTDIISHLKRFNNGIYSDEDRTFMLKELTGSVDGDFLSGYVGYLSKGNKYKDTPLKVDEDDNDLIDAQQTIFSNCCARYQGKRFEMYEILHCFSLLLSGERVYSLRRDDIFNGHNKKYLKSLLTAMKEHSVNNIEDFLRHIVYQDIFIAKDFMYPVYQIYPFVEMLWNSWNEFSKFLSTQKESDLIQEFKEFFGEYQKNNYQGIPFDFKIIHLR